MYFIGELVCFVQSNGGKIMTSILPIMILLLMIGIPASIMKLFSRNPHFKQWFRLILAGYLAVLLVGAVLGFFLPMKSNNISGKIVRAKVSEEYVDSYELAVKGTLDDEEYVFKQKEWSFDYQAEVLNLKTVNDLPFSAQIVVKKTAAGDGKITASFYRGRTYINQWDVTELTNPAQLSLEGTTLILENPEFLTLEFADFSNVFPVTQFTGGNWFDPGTNFSSGQDMLYLTIPKDVKIANQSALYIQHLD